MTDLRITEEERRERYVCRSSYENIPASELKLDPPFTPEEAARYDAERIRLHEWADQRKKEGKPVYFEMPFD